MNKEILANIISEYKWLEEYNRGLVGAELIEILKIDINEICQQYKEKVKQWVPDEEILSSAIKLRKEQNIAKAAVFNSYNELNFVDELNDRLGLHGSTWERHKKDGREIREAKLEKYILSEVDRYNLTIPRDEQGKPKLSYLNGPVVTREYFRRKYDEEASDFIKLQKSLAYNPELNFDQMIDYLFPLVYLDPTAINKAILKHWMSNVKRAVYQQSTFWDICLSICGDQGGGKTTFCRLLSIGAEDIRNGNKIDGPFKNYAREIEFKDFLGKDFYVWGSDYYVLLISEPSGAENLRVSPGDVATFKNRMDTQTFSSRVYYTQNVQNTQKIYSLMTSTNPPLSEIIPDYDDHRRLFEMRSNYNKDQYKLNPEIYEFDFLKLWQSVDEEKDFITDNHPLFQEIRKIQQTIYRSKKPLELFLECSEYKLPSDGEKTKKIRLDEFYLEFSNWGDERRHNVCSYDQFRKDALKIGLCEEKNSDAIVAIRSQEKTTFSFLEN